MEIESIISVPSVKVSGTLLFVVWVSHQLMNDFGFQNVTLGSLIMRVRSCVSIVSRSHNDYPWFIIFMSCLRLQKPWEMLSLHRIKEYLDWVTAFLILFAMWIIQTYQWPFFFTNDNFEISTSTARLLQIRGGGYLANFLRSVIFHIFRYCENKR